MKKLLEKGLTMVLVATMILASFPISSLAQSGASDKVKPFNSQVDMKNEGDENDLSLYNVYASGNHSATAADTEGALAIKNKSFIPNGGNFNYAAYFDNQQTGMGEHLTERHKIALLLGEKIEYGKVSQPLRVGAGHFVINEREPEWINSDEIGINGSIRSVDKNKSQDIFNHLDSQLNAVSQRLENLTKETTDYQDGSHTVTGGPDNQEWKVELSSQNERVVVIKAEPEKGSDTVFLPIVGGGNKKELDQIIVTSSAKKVMFYSEPSSIDKSASKANWVDRVYYLPNATQVTNFYSNATKDKAPDVDHTADGAVIDQDNFLNKDGSDPYSGQSSWTTNDKNPALTASLLAPKATVIWSGSAINGYAFVKNLHQRGNSEVHNFYNPWLFEELRGQIQITKLDELTRERLAGAEFEVKNKEDEVVGTIVTGADGIGYLGALEYGTYFVKETKAPDGYELDKEIRKVTIDEKTPNGLIQLEWENKQEVALGSIQLTKIDGQHRQLLAGAEFEVKNKDQELVGTIKTNEQGIGQLTELAFGTYFIQETKAPAGYELDKTIHEVTLDKDTAHQMIQLVMNNHKKEEIALGKLQVLKIDAQHRNFLAGAEFTVTDVKNDKLIETLTTTEEGLVQSKELPYGKYIVRETKAPEGYQLEDFEREVTISAKTPMVTLIVNNVEQPKGLLQVIKTDEATGKRLVGAEFSVKDSEQEEVATLTTDETGEAILTELAFGDYTVQETKAPEGYELDDTIYPVQVLNNGETPIVQLTITNRAIEPEEPTEELGSLQIEKRDEDTAKLLAGAEFRVTNEQGAETTITTNAQGLATLADLAYGNYEVQETKAPEDYELDDTIHHVTISKDSPNSLEVLQLTNKQEAKGKLMITKIDKDQPEFLAGAEFTIYTMDGNEVQKMVTEDNGVAVSDFLDFGQYQVKETKAPVGYELDETVHEITISQEDNNGLTEVTYTNEKQVGMLQLTKVDKNTAKVLAGAEFEVKNEAGEVVGTIQTNEEGVGQLGNLPFGDYLVKETKAPEGYQLDETEHKVTIKENNQENVVQVTYTNAKNLGSLQLTKLDKDTKTRLAGAEFKVSDAAGKQVGTIKTNELGIGILTNLPFGAYSVQETKAPEGYELDKTVFLVVVKDKHTQDNLVQVVMTNKLVEGTPIIPEENGNLEIQKVDAKTGKALQGAEFKIMDQDKKEITRLTSDKNGLASYGPLAFGTYYIQETKAPAGYQLDSTVYKRVLNKHTPNLTIQIKIKNELTPVAPEENGNLEIQKVDAKTGKALAGAEFKVMDQDKKEITRLTSDKNGLASYGPLAFGTYYIQETKAPAGYKLDSTVYKRVLNKNTPNLTIKIKIKNELTPVAPEENGNLEIQKVDAKTGKALQGAEFKIMDKNKKEITRLTSDKNGLASYGPLAFGTYYIQETKAPAGYQLDSTVYKRVLNKNTPNLTIKIKIKNELTPVAPEENGNLEIQKVDAKTGKALQGAEFKVMDQDKKEITRLTSDKNGLASYGPLAFGTYYIQETKAPAGYELDSTVYKRVLNKHTPNLTIQIKIKNELTPVAPEENGNLEIQKVDAKTGKALAGAEFKIMDQDKKEITRLTSDKNGLASYGPLAFGTYYIQETKAPAGYQLDSTIYKRVLNKNTPNLTIQIKIKNELLGQSGHSDNNFGNNNGSSQNNGKTTLGKTGKSLPQTGEETHPFATFLGLGVLVSLGIYYMLRRQNKQA